MDLAEYTRNSDRNKFWELPSGVAQNLLDEAIDRIAELEQQLAAMTAERDSESRWAKKYSDEADELRQQLAAAQEREKLWVSVKDQMPEMSMLNKKYQVVVDAEFFAGDFCNENGEPISGNITHWYEIPKQEVADESL